MLKLRKAFTLIELIVAVMIISVVIMALFEMQGNNSQLFSKFYNKIQINQVVSLFVSNKEYGFEKEDIYLDDLLIEFRLEDDLRRKLKEIKVELDYEELQEIDMSMQSDEEESESQDEDKSSSAFILEIGKTILKVDDTSSSIIRLRIQ